MEEYQAKSPYRLWIRSYILPVLLMGGAFYKTNVTLIEGNAPVRLSIGVLIILGAVFGYVIFSWRSLKKIVSENIATSAIGLAFIIISILTSCFQNEYWLVSLKFSIKVYVLFFMLVLIYQHSLVSRGTLTALFVIMISVNLIGVLEYFYCDKMEDFLLLFKSREALVPYRYGRISSIFPNPNPFAVFNAIFIVMTLYLTYYHLQKVNRYICGLSLLLCILGIFLSSSRNALLTIVLGILFFVLSLTKEKKNLLTVSAMAVFTLAVVFSGLYVHESMAKRFNGLISLTSIIHDGDALGYTEIVSALNLKGRMDIWRRGIDLFLEKPVFGIGASQFMMRNGLVGGEGCNAHNIFGEILVSHGFFGFALFLILIGAWIRKAVMRWQLLLIITLFISHLFDCFVTYSAMWLILTPWLIALTTKNRDGKFFIDDLNHPGEQVGSMQENLS